MPEYIEKDAFIANLDACISRLRIEAGRDRLKNAAVNLVHCARDCAAKTPAAAVEPVVNAKWITIYRTTFGSVTGVDTACSNCRKPAEVLQAGGGCEFISPRCPYCGAHMDGGVLNDDSLDG